MTIKENTRRRRPGITDVKRLTVQQSDCWRTMCISAPCQKCGRREEPVHSPQFLKGFFCSTCCPVCNQAKPTASEVGGQVPPPAHSQGAGRAKPFGAAQKRVTGSRKLERGVR